MEKIQRSLVLLLTIMVIGSGMFVLYSLATAPTDKVYFSRQDTTFVVEVARDEHVKARGLSGRKSLDQNHGMWFVYDNEAARTFWMKDMNFPIDIIWLDSHKRIVGIVHSAPPPDPETNDSELLSYVSPGSTQYVLEISAGLAEEIGLRLGDQAVRQ